MKRKRNLLLGEEEENKMRITGKEHKRESELLISEVLKPREVFTRGRNKSREEKILTGPGYSKGEL